MEKSDLIKIKSSLIHTALFCKGWYKIKYLHDTGSFKEFVDNLWKNMAIYLAEDCMYEFKTQDQVIHKLLNHLDYVNMFKNDNCRIGKLPWLYEEVKRIQTYCNDIDFEAAIVYVCYTVFQCAHKDCFRDPLIPNYVKFEMSDTIIERIKDEPDFLSTHQCILNSENDER